MNKFLLLTILFLSRSSRFITSPLTATLDKTTATPTTDTTVAEEDDLEFDESCDNIVIGSGIGGLTVASLLSQIDNERTTLLLEQYDKIGGNLHTFDRKGYPFAVGIHYVGEMQQDATGLKVASLLQALQPPDDAVEWSALPDNFDTVLIGRNDLKRYDIRAHEQCRDLQKAFPESKRKIARYFRQVRKATRAAKRSIAFKMMPRKIAQFLVQTGLHKFVNRGYTKYAGKSVGQVLDDLRIDDPELRAVLAYSWGDYGSTPDSAPFLMHALLTMHYSKGAYYPIGSPSEIPRKIVKQINACNGQVRTKSGVQRILVQNGRAVGVELQSGRKIQARNAVISDAGYCNTVQHLLPPDTVLTATKEETASLRTGATGLSLYVGLEGDHDTDWQLPHQQLWIYPDNNMEGMLQRYPDSLSEALKTLEPADLVPVFVGAPSGKDSSWKDRHPGRSTLEILTGAPWEWFASFAPTETTQQAADFGGPPYSHGPEYKEIKEQLAQLLWTRARQGLIATGASKQLPERVQDTDFYELGSPLTYAHYLWSNHGAFYGLEHSVERFDPHPFYVTLRPETKLPGLYLTGQDVAACGMAGAMAGGYLTASKILGVWHPFSLIHKVKKAQRKQLQAVQK